jgi:hypothetical protein
VFRQRQVSEYWDRSVAERAAGLQSFVATVKVRR